MNELTPADTDLAGLLDITPDVVAVLRRDTEVPGPAGRTATVVERARLVRLDRVVLLTVPAVGDLRGNVHALICPDRESAAVAYVTEQDALRRDGWTPDTPTTDTEGK